MTEIVGVYASNMYALTFYWLYAGIFLKITRELQLNIK